MTTQLQKTFLSILALLLVIGFTSFQNKATAQLAVGGGLAYGSDIESAGVQVGGTYFLLEEQGIRLAADLIFFFPGEDGFGVDVNVWEFNANGHYIFNEADAFLAYALAGISLATVSVDIAGFGEASDSELGLNAGAGIEYSIGGVKLYAEGKIVLGGFDQLVLSGGVRVPIGNN